MTTLNILLAVRLTLELVEVIIFQLGAVILGFAIHFFLKSRNSAFTTIISHDKVADADELRLKFYEELDKSRAEVQQLETDNAKLKQQKTELARKVLELEDLIEQSTEQHKNELEAAGEENYLTALSHTHERLNEQNKLVQALLIKVESMKAAEFEIAEYKKLNVEYSLENTKLASLLSEKEMVISELSVKVSLLEEMKCRLETTYAEFHSVQQKLQSMQSQLALPATRTYEFNELQQLYLRVTKEFDELKLSNFSLVEENERFKRAINDLEEKLREANFHRQQLARKVNFLEELSGNLNHLAGHQRTLESQLRRLGELESVMVNRIPETNT